MPLTAWDILKPPILNDLVTGADVDKCKRLADIDWKNVNAQVGACAVLSAEDRAAWGREYSAWQAFAASKSSLLVGAGKELDQCVEYAKRLPAWVARLEAKGCRGVGPPPPDPTPPSSPSTKVAWVVGGVVVVGVGLAALWIYTAGKTVRAVAPHAAPIIRDQLRAQRGTQREAMRALGGAARLAV